MAVINGRGRAAINVGDGLECLVGERQVVGGAVGVEDNCRGALIGGGTTREATREGGGRSGKTDDGVVNWPSVDRWGRARRGPMIGTRLGTSCGADVTGR